MSEDNKKTISIPAFIAIIFVLFIAFGAVVFVVRGDLLNQAKQTGEETKKQIINAKWEYKIVSISDVTFETEMDRLGNDGWELVFARRAIGKYDQGVYEMIFKRKK